MPFVEYIEAMNKNDYYPICSEKYCVTGPYVGWASSSHLVLMAFGALGSDFFNDEIFSVTISQSISKCYLVTNGMRHEA